ncbi:zinc-dependent metalloprotease [Filimonas effusa]|uniref:DUF5117 domain-containing protein n=1 Tax=Filimonas effusa TaxID=2508721 RepID=A0A4Q1D5K4_9BACT|nr:zinc-dependent metalloprotease [Filimonas effusa]RXK83133.1 DUF5117 domain-containing protein [Filimonas effusa]
MKQWMMLLSVLAVTAGTAQEKEKAAVKDQAAEPATTGKMPSFEKVIGKNAVASHGMFTVYATDNRYYFEIPDSLFNRDILTVTRYIATPEQAGVFGGEKANEQTIFFEKGLQQKIFLRSSVARATVASSTEAIYKAVQASGVKPIIAVFDIKTVNPANGNIVIDVTDLFRKDNTITSISSRDKTELKLGSLADDRSFITKMSSYPINIEVKTLKTYTTSAAAAIAGAATGVVTYELNTSMVLLPLVPMRRRLADERVGYFANRYLLFSDSAQQATSYNFIQRYRLEPKEEDIEKYKRGELVEPKKQIVYYIDPATPKKWRPYLIAGVNDWQKAFEQAGFKNAIIGKEWPENDTTMSMEDARFSVIRYLASETPNAYGPRISDPRSGEIIESHVGWYHNVMTLVHDWYMVQAGALDTRARKMEFDDELMGDLIRFVSSHEIGHTIGLRHNMGASSQTPVELLRNKAWVEANGHTVSIMDYARFNYVAQPGDNISKAGLYPRIGIYDKWAIQWGYQQLFGVNDEYQESKLLKKQVADSLAADPRLWFGGEGTSSDPRAQKEDIGDDVMKANEYGIKNLKRVIAKLPEWTAEEGDLYSNLARMYKAVTRQYNLYIGHVSRYLGGEYITLRSTEQKGDVYEPVSAEKMKSAVQFLSKNLLEPPLWLYPAEITSKLGINKMELISVQQNNTMNLLLSPGLLYNIFAKQVEKPGAYTVSTYLADLKRLVWQNKAGSEEQQIYRRNIQRMYVERIGMILKTKNMAEGKMLTNAERSEARLYVLLHLKQLRTEIAASTPATAIERAHKEDLLKNIDLLLKPKD